MADGDKELVPQLRFEGFTDAWVQRKLGEVLKVNSGRDYKHLNAGDVPVYGTGGYMLSVDKRLSDIDAIGIGRKGTIDKPQLLSAPFWTVDTLFFMTPLHDNDLLFLYALSQNIEWAKMDESTGVPSLSKANIENVASYISGTAEQTAIGKFFHTLDNLITSNQRKLEGLKELKKGYLQQMFPQAGESVPRVRFEGFSGNWAQRKLAEVADYRNGKAHEQNILTDERNIVKKGKYIVVNSKFVSTNGEVRKYCNEQIEPLFAKEIAFVLSDVPNGRAIARTFLIDIDGKYSLNQRIAGITPHSDTDSYFLHLMLNRNPYFLKFDDGVGQTNLSKGEVENFMSYYPAYEEQVAVGNFFHTQDKLITAQAQKVEKLKQLKAAYLQKMFV